MTALTPRPRTQGSDAGFAVFGADGAVTVDKKILGLAIEALIGLGARAGTTLVVAGGAGGTLTILGWVDENE